MSELRELDRLFSPVCEKCGFMTGEQGVVELARIEKENADAEDEARGLLEFISVSFVLLAIGYLLTFFGPEFSTTVIFASIICAGLFWGKLAGWHRKYSSIEFPDERFDAAKRIRNKASVIGIAICLMTALLIYKMIGE